MKFHQPIYCRKSVLLFYNTHCKFSSNIDRMGINNSHPGFKVRCKPLPPVGPKRDHDIVLFDTLHIYIAPGLHVGRFSYGRKQICMDCALTYLRQARHYCQQNLKTLTLCGQPSRLLSVLLWTNMCQQRWPAPVKLIPGSHKPAKMDEKKTACTSKSEKLGTGNATKNYKQKFKGPQGMLTGVTLRR